MSSNEEQLTMSLKVWHIPYKTVRQKCYTWGELETWLKKCFGEGHFTLNPGETGYVISAPKEVGLPNKPDKETRIPYGVVWNLGWTDAHQLLNWLNVKYGEGNFNVELRQGDYIFVAPEEVKLPRNPQGN